MRATLREFHSPDVDLDTYAPFDAKDDAVFVQMFVGPADGPGEESFNVVVCTPAWLERKAKEDGPILGRHYLIVDSLDVKAALSFLRKQVESVTAPTWAELGGLLGRIGHWEFEDYTPAPPAQAQ